MKIYEIRRCAECDGEVNEHWFGTEGVSRCSDCGTVEGKEYTSFEDEHGNKRTEDEYISSLKDMLAQPQPAWVSEYRRYADRASDNREVVLGPDEWLASRNAVV